MFLRPLVPTPGISFQYQDDSDHLIEVLSYSMHWCMRMALVRQIHESWNQKCVLSAFYSQRCSSHEMPCWPWKICDLMQTSGKQQQKTLELQCEEMNTALQLLIKEVEAASQTKTQVRNESLIQAIDLQVHDLLHPKTLSMLRPPPIRPPNIAQKLQLVMRGLLENVCFVCFSTLSMEG